MNDANDKHLTEIGRELLRQMAPDCELLSIAPLPGSYSNETHLLTARAPSGDALRLAVRRYAVFGDYDRGEKARREFKTLELLHGQGIPVPTPFFLDDAGVVLGTPGIVTRYVPGELVLSPADPIDWAEKLARMLARIHAVPVGGAARSFLLDADAEASWFLRPEAPPAFMRAHPDGEAVWGTARALWSRARRESPGLVHVDYWSGNVLWDGGEIAAVVDWEEAAWGDAGIDVAYARMEMFLLGLDAAADVFLRVYEAERGRRVANLVLWELAAAARPMFSPEGWVSEMPASRRFHQFIERSRALAAV